jgi:hypothetical protein
MHSLFPTLMLTFSQALQSIKNNTLNATKRRIATIKVKHSFVD